MNLSDMNQLYDKLEMLKSKVSTITSITDAEKEILLIMTELIDNTFRIVDDVRETMEI